MVSSGRGTESGGSSSFLGSEYCFFFFTILVFSAVDNYFITGFDSQEVIFASLTTAKRGGGEIQALSRRVSFSSSAAGLSYVPELVAKTESALRPLSRSFEVPSLGGILRRVCLRTYYGVLCVRVQSIWIVRRV